MEEQVSVEELLEFAEITIAKADELKERMTRSEDSIVDGIDNIEFKFRLDTISNFSREIKEILSIEE